MQAVTAGSAFFVAAVFVAAFFAGADFLAAVPRPPEPEVAFFAGARRVRAGAGQSDPIAAAGLTTDHGQNPQRERNKKRQDQREMA